MEYPLAEKGHLVECERTYNFSCSCGISRLMVLEVWKKEIEDSAPVNTRPNFLHCDIRQEHSTLKPVVVERFNKRIKDLKRNFL